MLARTSRTERDNERRGPGVVDAAFLRRSAARAEERRRPIAAIAALPVLEWRTWASGLVLGAFIGGTPLCGISGPHPNGRYSLTFYGGKLERRAREMFVRRREHAIALAERVLELKRVARAARQS